MNTGAKPIGFLGGRVKNLRSQGLNFAREGIEFSLDIPDTQDVKEIMGTMVETIVTQESQITALQEELVAAANRNKRMQEEMREWTNRCMDQLRNESSALKTKIDENQRKFNNFTFNIQVSDIFFCYKLLNYDQQQIHYDVLCDFV
jgi:hypothetical protein